MANCGSSPRTRGTVRHAEPSVVAVRFIPAHAGNSQVGREGVEHDAVHPRARGEQLHGREIEAIDTGSSPRTRGTVREPTAGWRRGRFIPAHAGNRLPPARHSLTPTVHPRARGEQRWRGVRWRSSRGSSPRTRGTDLRSRHRSCPARFIPAHAGNREPVLVATRRPAVHPRARGEQAVQQGHGGALVGSSPRTRGTDALTSWAYNVGRFIPAHAGNS